MKSDKWSFSDYVLWGAAAVLVLLKLPLASLTWVGWDYAWGILAMGCLIVGVLRKDACFSLKWGGGLLLFLIVAAIGVAVNEPAPVFRSWLRWGYLSLVVLLLSPVLRSGMLDVLRRRMCVVVCWSLLLGLAVSGLSYVVLALAGELPDTFSGVYNHPMTAAFMASLSFCVCMFFFMSRRGRVSWQEWVALSGAVLSLLLVCAGGSRVALLSVIVVFAFYAVIDRHKRVAIAGGVMLTCCMLLFVIPGAADEVFKILLRKFSSGVTHESLTWSRDSLWEARWEEFLSSPWVGIGIGNQTVFAEPWDDVDFIITTGNIEPGSSWLAVLSQTGMVGLIAFLTYNTQVVLSALKKQSFFSKVRLPVLFLIIYVALLVQSVTEGYMLSGGSTFCMIFWLMSGQIVVFGNKAFDKMRRAVTEI